MLYKNSILLVLLWISSGIAFAHSGDITGSLNDSITGVPVSDADIIIEGSPWTTVSDGTGTFKFHNIPDGKYTLIVSHLSYKTKKIVIEVKGNETLILAIKLKKSNFTLAETAIIGNKEPEKMLTRLNLIDVELRPITSSQDILRIVPGLVTAQHAGGGKAEQIYLRGVDNDHGTDFNISVDGMPVNMVSHAHGQGYADLHFLIPEIIDHIEFNKGAYYAKKGNFTTTGYADFKTKNRLDNSILKLEAGNFNTLRLMTAFNLYNNEKTHQNIYLAGEFLYSDSYFESPQLFKRINLFAKYFGKVSESSYLSLSVSTFKSNWNHSGQIPDRAVERGWITRFGAIDDSEGGFTGRTNLNAELSTRLSDNVLIKNQLYYSKYDFKLWSNFTFFLNDTVNGDQILQKENRNIFGYHGNVSVFSKIGSKDFKSDFGIGLRYDDINGDQLVHTYKRNTVLDTFSIGNVNETNAFIYYSGDINLSDKFLINIGLRYDYFIFQYTDNLQPVFSLYYKYSGIFSPKLNFFYNPNPKLQFYLKTGSGFHSNDSRLIALQQVDKDLPRSVNGDFGSFFKLFDRIVMNVAVWTMYMEQEFVYVGDEAVVEPKGETMRYGADVSLRYQLSGHLFLDVDYNYSYGYFINLPENQNYIPLAPVHTSMGGLSYKSSKGLNVGLRYRYVSDRPANEDNSVIALGYFLTEVAASYKWQHIEFFVRADNLFNIDWNEAQFDTESRLRYPDADGNFTGELEPEPVSELHYTPGYPFSIRGGMILKF